MFLVLFACVKRIKIVHLEHFFKVRASPWSSMFNVLMYKKNIFFDYIYKLIYIKSLINFLKYIFHTADSINYFFYICIGNSSK